jgi:uncharacterized protein YjiS (DUF1127 family)
MAVFTVNFRTAAAQPGPSLVKRVWVKRVWVNLRHAVEKQQTRRLLAQMDDRQLSDIGVSRAEAGYEAERPVWDAGLR